MIKLMYFLNESNGIEGIEALVNNYQIRGAEIFMALRVLTVADVSNIVKIFEPKAKLREQFGQNVEVGDYVAPGGPEIRQHLKDILTDVNINRCHPVHIHKDFENLHPYSDCNGRSGRLVWLWQMEKFDYTFYNTFLRSFYYQALNQL